jgi:ribulose-bisphosphate carboxylase small chain
MMTNPTGRVTQGQFSFLPDLGDDEIRAQIDYGLAKGYAWSVEYTDDPHPRNTYWEMFGMPMFDLGEPPGSLRSPPPEGAEPTRERPVAGSGADGVLQALNDCRKTFPNHYIRLMAFDSTRGVESIAMSFIVNRPAHEPGFGLARTEGEGRTMRYRISSYATDRPEGERYAR